MSVLEILQGILTFYSAYLPALTMQIHTITSPALPEQFHSEIVMLVSHLVKLTHQGIQVNWRRRPLEFLSPTPLTQ